MSYDKTQPSLDAGFYDPIEEEPTNLGFDASASRSKSAVNHARNTNIKMKRSKTAVSKRLVNTPVFNTSETSLMNRMQAASLEEDADFRPIARLSASRVKRKPGSSKAFRNRRTPRIDGDAGPTVASPPISPMATSALSRKKSTRSPTKGVRKMGTLTRTLGKSGIRTLRSALHRQNSVSARNTERSPGNLGQGSTLLRSSVSKKPGHLRNEDQPKVENMSLSLSRMVPKNPNIAERLNSVHTVISVQSNSSIQSLRSARHRKSRYSMVVQNTLTDLQRKVSMKDAKKDSRSKDQQFTQSQIDLEASSLVRLPKVTKSRVLRKSKADGPNYFFYELRYDNFDCFEMADEEMYGFMEEAMSALGLSALFKDDKTLLINFLSEVRHQYKPDSEVPFHNFFHGFSVAQVGLCFILRSPALRKLFKKRTMLSFLIAAIGHDAAHPGTDNYYEVTSNSSNAKLFGKDSVLENHHTNTILKILNSADQDLNVFQHLSALDQELSFSELAEFVLATDMQKHNEHLEYLRSLESLEDLNMLNEDENMYLLQCVIHASDLSGQCMDKDLAIRWEQNINAEMRMQYNLLKEKNLPLPKHLMHFEGSEDEESKARYKSQAGFIEFVLLPYWIEIVRLFPGMDDFLENLQSNLAYFKERMN